MTQMGLIKDKTRLSMKVAQIRAPGTISINR